MYIDWSLRILGWVPRLWNTTIETHRVQVREAILDATAGLVGEHGLRAVTMAQIADDAGIGRATLYKYFPDVDAILIAWHDRQVSAHLSRLAEIPARVEGGADRLDAVLRAYASMTFAAREHRETDVARMVHRVGHVAHAEQHLKAMIVDLIAAAAAEGSVRTDVSPEELAEYCLHALAAADRLPSTDAVARLVAVVLAGLRPHD